ncbi:phosphate ABC transporter permease subunit PstC [Brevibacillus humidisoli]|uniref:phosphate ABC transporter permease subunit PstC n=1 Tax=Brevibacillus humidisoli TaxID=2895522 RepID=UPI001E353312|nr:phosphate ABC transporter permease subunit PstC [Brevibacillus humidisoli]UFJ40931.1 phosphate ABC transporter permease subunit PstC [Brevibacillus humidisoli]
MQGSVTSEKKKVSRWPDKLVPAFLFSSSLLTVLTTVGIVLVLLSETLRFFGEVSLLEFLTSTKWTPQFADKNFGILPLLNGTLMITVIASLVAIPIGLGTAIYLSEYAPEKVRKVVKPILEILAGVPTIVYGYFALTFVTPLIRGIIPDTSVYNALSASLVVGIMILPMVASLSEDAMLAVPRSLRNGAYALGATRFEVALRVVVPAALSGIIASFVLALSRAIGETMIVTIAAGALAQVTMNPLESVQTMTAFIVNISLGDVEPGSIESRSIFAVGMTLFVMTLGLNLIAQFISRRYKEEY